MGKAGMIPDLSGSRMGGGGASVRTKIVVPLARRRKILILAFLSPHSLAGMAEW